MLTKEDKALEYIQANRGHTRREIRDALEWDDNEVGCTMTSLMSAEKVVIAGTVPNPPHGEMAVYDLSPAVIFAGVMSRVWDGELRITTKPQ